MEVIIVLLAASASIGYLIADGTGIAIGVLIASVIIVIRL